jgi:hypothetical protein
LSQAGFVSNIGSAQALPHPPQLAELAKVSVSQPSSAAGAAGVVQLPLPSTQVDVQSPALHTAAATPCPEQARVQDPQWAGSVSVFVSQPLVGSPSQSAQPMSHAATVHAACAQPAVPCATVHAVAHDPQCCGSPLTSCSQPLVGSPSQSSQPRRQWGAHMPPAQAVVPWSLRQGAHEVLAQPTAGSLESAHASPQRFSPTPHPLPPVPLLTPPVPELLDDPVAPPWPPVPELAVDPVAPPWPPVPDCPPWAPVPVVTVEPVDPHPAAQATNPPSNSAPVRENQRMRASWHAAS